MPPKHYFSALLICICALVLLPSVESFAQGGQLGGLSGVVRDEAGKPLEHANVVIKELGLGRITNATGRYEFEDLRPGAYTVRAQLISYETGERTGVLVSASDVATLDFSLKETIAAHIEGYSFESDKIDALKKDDSTTIRSVDTKEIAKIRAINTTEEAIATQAGVVQLGNDFFVRGGRSGEVKTVVDGMPVSDAFAGSAGSGTLDIALTSQEGLTLRTGGFDAEYGNAQSGIVEIATREGGEQYEGQVKFLTDDFGAPDRTYFNYDNVAVGFGGPVPFVGERVRFFVSGEGVFQDTYLKTLENRRARKLFFNSTELASLRDRQENAIRGQTKVTYRLGGARKVSVEYLFSRESNDWYHHSFSRVGYYSQDAANREDGRPAWWFEPFDGDSTYTYYNGPAHLSERHSRNDQYKIVYTHPLTSDSFVTTRFAMFRTQYKENVGDKSPDQYVPFSGGDEERDPANLFFAVVGDYPVWVDRKSDQFTFRADYQNKIGGGTHELKTGMSFDYYDLFKDSRQNTDEEDPLGDFPNQYQQNALGGVLYVQDRLRYRKSMVLNAGLRFDFFDPGEEAIRVSNQRVIALEKPTEGISFFERWKAQISPRLGMSYPISDRDVLHFHYGRFFQLPDLEFLYDYSGNPNIGNQTVGNAFLDPETTISYEFGVRRQLSDRVYIDATVFFKDIFGLIGTSSLEAERESEANRFNNVTFLNKDYGSVRGFELALDKRFSSYWQGGVSYTLSRATGSSSDVNQGAVVATEGQDREPIREVPLSWDITHVISSHLFFSDPGVWQLNFDLNIAGGSPVSPLRLGQRGVRAEEINTLRLPYTMTINMRANKLYALYGREFRLFLSGRNLLDRRNVFDHRPGLFPTPDQEYYRQYFTEFGEFGGAYNLADTIGTTEDILVPLNDPRVYGEPRVFRVGIQFEW